MCGSYVLALLQRSGAHHEADDPPSQAPPLSVGSEASLVLLSYFILAYWEPGEEVGFYCEPLPNVAPGWTCPAGAIDVSRATRGVPVVKWQPKVADVQLP